MDSYYTAAANYGYYGTDPYAAAYGTTTAAAPAAPSAAAVAQSAYTAQAAAEYAAYTKAVADYNKWHQDYTKWYNATYGAATTQQQPQHQKPVQPQSTATASLGTLPPPPPPGQPPETTPAATASAVQPAAPASYTYGGYSVGATWPQTAANAAYDQYAGTPYAGYYGNDSTTAATASASHYATAGSYMTGHEYGQSAEAGKKSYGKKVANQPDYSQSSAYVTGMTTSGYGKLHAGSTQAYSAESHYSTDPTYDKTPTYANVLTHYAQHGISAPPPPPKRAYDQAPQTTGDPVMYLVKPKKKKPKRKKTEEERKMKKTMRLRRSILLPGMYDESETETETEPSEDEEEKKANLEKKKKERQQSQRPVQVVPPQVLKEHGYAEWGSAIDAEDVTDVKGDPLNAHLKLLDPELSSKVHAVDIEDPGSLYPSLVSRIADGGKSGFVEWGEAAKDAATDNATPVESKEPVVPDSETETKTPAVIRLSGNKAMAPRSMAAALSQVLNPDAEIVVEGQENEPDESEDKKEKRKKKKKKRQEEVEDGEDVNPGRNLLGVAALMAAMSATEPEPPKEKPPLQVEMEMDIDMDGPELGIYVPASLSDVPPPFPGMKRMPPPILKKRPQYDSNMDSAWSNRPGSSWAKDEGEWGCKRSKLDGSEMTWESEENTWGDDGSNWYDGGITWKREKKTWCSDASLNPLKSEWDSNSMDPDADGQSYDEPPHRPSSGWTPFGPKSVPDTCDVHLSSGKRSGLAPPSHFSDKSSDLPVAGLLSTENRFTRALKGLEPVAPSVNRFSALFEKDAFKKVSSESTHAVASSSKAPSAVLPPTRAPSAVPPPTRAPSAVPPPTRAASAVPPPARPASAVPQPVKPASAVPQPVRPSPARPSLVKVPSAVPPPSLHSPVFPPPSAHSPVFPPPSGPPPSIYSPSVPPPSVYSPTVPPPSVYSPLVPPPTLHSSSVPPPAIPPPSRFTVPPPELPRVPRSRVDTGVTEVKTNLPVTDLPRGAEHDENLGGKIKSDLLYEISTSDDPRETASRILADLSLRIDLDHRWDLTRLIGKKVQERLQQLTPPETAEPDWQNDWTHSGGGAPSEQAVSNSSYFNELKMQEKSVEIQKSRRFTETEFCLPVEFGKNREKYEGLVIRARHIPKMKQKIDKPPETVEEAKRLKNDIELSSANKESKMASFAIKRTLPPALFEMLKNEQMQNEESVDAEEPLKKDDVEASSASEESKNASLAIDPTLPPALFDILKTDKVSENEETSKNVETSEKGEEALENESAEKGESEKKEEISVDNEASSEEPVQKVIKRASKWGPQIVMPEGPTVANPKPQKSPRLPGSTPIPGPSKNTAQAREDMTKAAQKALEKIPTTLVNAQIGYNRFMPSSI